MPQDTSIQIDLRAVTKECFKINVQYKNMFLVKLGLFFIKIGCWISGVQLVDEFPMSLYQETKDIG